jgi:hypothetical protein
MRISGKTWEIQVEGDIPSKRIQQIPDHFPLLGDFTGQDDAGGS